MEDMIRAAQQGDEAAFDRLVSEYGPSIYRYFYRLTGNHADTDDLAQEVFLTVFQSLQAFTPGTNFRAWIFTIARNRFLNFSARRRREKAHAMIQLPSETGDDTVAAAADAATVQKAVARAIAGLPDDLRQVVILRIMEGLPHQEIARILDCNERTVRWRLFSARRKLQKMLTDYFPIEGERHGMPEYSGISV